MSDPFDHAWRIVKGEQKIGYHLQIPITNQMESELFDQFFDDMRQAGVKFDWGGGAGGFDIHLDHSLKGASPEYVKEYLNKTGLNFNMSVEVYEEEDDATISRHPLAGMGAPQAPLPNPVKIHDPAGQDAVIVGPPIMCPCGENPEGALIRESAEDGGHLNFACNMCGHMELASDAYPGEGYE